MDLLRPLPAFLILLVVLFVIIGGFYVIFPNSGPFLGGKGPANQQTISTKPMGTLTIKSSAFKNNETIPRKYTCDGENVNPLIEILGVPKEAKSLALIMDDPDATGGVTWTHWLVWNIDPQTTYIEEDTLPPGAIEGKTSFGKTGYGGPCPPRGSKPHRYMFKVYALDITLGLMEGEGKTELMKAMEGHVLAEGTLTGLYQRK